MKYLTSTIRNAERSSQQMQILFWGLTATIILMSVMYMYFVNKTVWNVVARQNIEKNMSAMSSKLSDKEFQYINSVSAITMDTANRMGFVSADKATTFVAKVDLNKNVAIR